MIIVCASPLSQDPLTIKRNIAPFNACRWVKLALVFGKRTVPAVKRLDIQESVYPSSKPDSSSATTAATVDN